VQHRRGRWGRRGAIDSRARPIHPQIEARGAGRDGEEVVDACSSSSDADACSSSTTPLLQRQCLHELRRCGHCPLDLRLASLPSATTRSFPMPAGAQLSVSIHEGWGTLLEALLFCSTGFSSPMLHIGAFCRCATVGDSPRGPL
jgi:hypothetical protein